LAVLGALACAAAAHAQAPVSDVATVLHPDPRVAGHVPGHRPGEVAYFVQVRGAATVARGQALHALGARILDRYTIAPAFAVASQRAAVRPIAALHWVTRLEPVQLVHAQADEALADQTRGSPADIRATALWNNGITGAGVTIAVIDTGIDATHGDLDDLDFRHWSTGGPPKVQAQRDFTHGGCSPDLTTDGHGHGTHVAGIAAGTGEGGPLAGDNGTYAGIAPGASLGVAKALDASGNGVNSDLLKAMEWAASPPTTVVCPGLIPVYGLGADIVNMSLGSDSRPARLNSGSDADLVSITLDRLARDYGTLFVAAVGNNGPFIGTALESPGSASQALSVGATAKDYDVNHDDTYSGDTCAGWLHPFSGGLDNTCAAGVGTQPPSLASLSSRGPSGDLWLRPDVVAPGYNIVAPQAKLGTAIASNDLNLGTRADPLYATASGTSMAAPTVAGASALLLQGYRKAYGADLPRPRYALLRAALMNTAATDLYEARWILRNSADNPFNCTLFTDPLLPLLCGFAQVAAGTQTGSSTLYEVRNGKGDPYVGPLGEGAGNIDVGAALRALTGGAVMYSAQAGDGTGPRELQGSWQIGAVRAGTKATQTFVIHGAPAAGKLTVRFAFAGGHPSDTSRAIGWAFKAPGSATVPAGGNATVTFSLDVPGGAAPGSYTGAVIAKVSNGQVLHVPVYASVALHDPNAAAGNAPGAQAKVDAERVFAKGDTIWPAAAGQTLTGALSDWLVYPVDLGSGLTRARFTAWDTATQPGTETYDLYVYDAGLNLEASTHPFITPGTTDVAANQSRAASTQTVPQALTLTRPAPGRHYVVVDRARIGGSCPCSGDFGSFSLRLDETTAP
jgi:subtilisin family serine protease